MPALHPHLKLLSARIRKLRQRSPWSQENFAVHIGLARSYYSAVERGERNPGAINLIKIAGGLGVEVGELFPPMASLPELRTKSKTRGTRKSVADAAKAISESELPKPGELGDGEPSGPLVPGLDW